MPTVRAFAWFACAVMVSGCDASSKECSAAVIAVGLTNAAPDATYLALTAPQMNAVVQVRFGLEPSSADVCSGVLIAPSLVLSAAHCARHYGTDTVSVVFGSDASVPAWTTEANAIVHPDHDLMLLELASPPMDEIDVVPLALASPSEVTTATDALVQVGGYGDDASGTFGARGFLVERVTDITDSEVTVSAEGLAGACFGDSGGPLLIRDASGRASVVGVLSRGAISCFGSDRYTRADVHRSWLESHGLEATVDSSLSESTLALRGRCFGSTAVWVQDGEPMAQACGDECGWNAPAGGYRCIEAALDPCEGIDEVGVCVGDEALHCAAGAIEAVDCGLCGATCARSPRTGSAICIADR